MAAGPGSGTTSTSVLIRGIQSAEASQYSASRRRASEPAYSTRRFAHCWKEVLLSGSETASARASCSRAVFRSSSSTRQDTPSTTR